MYLLPSWRPKVKALCALRVNSRFATQPKQLPAFGFGEGEQQLRQAAGIVAGDLVLDQQVGAQRLDSQLAHGVEVQLDRCGAFGGVPS